MSPLDSSHLLCRPWFPCSHQNYLHHFSYSLSTYYSLHHSTHRRQSLVTTDVVLVWRIETLPGVHDKIIWECMFRPQMVIGNDPISCVLLNLCMVYMLKGLEELSLVPPV
jgi:hypothetical protein